MVRRAVVGGRRIARKLRKFLGAKIDEVSGGEGLIGAGFAGGPLHNVHVSGARAGVSSFSFGLDGLLVEECQGICGVDKRLAQGGAGSIGSVGRFHVRGKDGEVVAGESKSKRCTS